MHNGRTLSRAVFLALSLIPATAIAAKSGPPAPVRAPHFVPTGVYGAYLSGTFAADQGNAATAATDLLRALSLDPLNTELRTRAFLAAALAGRPEAARLARYMPDNPAAQLLLADIDARAGRWSEAVKRFRSLPRTGGTEVLRPLLIAWAEQGGGHTGAALNTLRPYVESSRFKGIYALHAGAIADLAGRKADAARYYKIAENEFGGTNLRMLQIVASWEARQGHEEAAKQRLATLTGSARGLAMAVPALEEAVGKRVVRSATDGIAESYLALAATLQQQNANGFAELLLRLALEMRPNFAPARLLLADIQSADQHPEAALRTLAAVPADDPLIAPVRLRQAQLDDSVGRSDKALHILRTLAHDNPMRPEPHELMGDILREQHQYAAAAAAYTQAIARTPHIDRGDWPLFYQRGIAYDRSGQWDKAQADFEHALKLSPDQPYVLNYLGYSWADQGRNLTRARQMLEKAVAARPNDGAIVDSLGWVMLRQGDKQGAVKMLVHAVELSPEDPEINGHLGDAFWAVGRKLDAAYQWSRALSLSPEASAVPKLEAKLQEADAALAPKPTGSAAATPAPAQGQN